MNFFTVLFLRGAAGVVRLRRMKNAFFAWAGNISWNDSFVLISRDMGCGDGCVCEAALRFRREMRHQCIIWPTITQIMSGILGQEGEI